MEDTRESKLMHICEAVKAQTEEDILAQSIMLHKVWTDHNKKGGRIWRTRKKQI